MMTPLPKTSSPVSASCHAANWPEAMPDWGLSKTKVAGAVP